MLREEKETDVNPREMRSRVPSLRYSIWMPALHAEEQGDMLFHREAGVDPVRHLMPGILVTK